MLQFLYLPLFVLKCEQWGGCCIQGFTLQLGSSRLQRGSVNKSLMKQQQNFSERLNCSHSQRRNGPKGHHKNQFESKNNQAYQLQLGSSRLQQGSVNKSLVKQEQNFSERFNCSD